MKFCSAIGVQLSIDVQQEQTESDKNGCIKVNLFKYSILSKLLHNNTH